MPTIGHCTHQGVAPMGWEGQWVHCTSRWGLQVGVVGITPMIREGALGIGHVSVVSHPWDGREAWWAAMGIVPATRSWAWWVSGHCAC